MFCDENGFSLTRTLTTASTIAGFAAVAAIPGVGPAIASPELLLVHILLK